MDKEGRLKVDKFLQVEGVKDVYAIGDCSNVPELKVATGAQAHGEHVAANIQLLANGKEAKPYTINGKESLPCFNKYFRKEQIATYLHILCFIAK